MGSKTQTSTTSSQPNPQVLANYNTLLGAATDIATRPYNYYGGQLTAGMNDTQGYGLSTANQAGIPIQESLNTSGAVNSAASTLFNNVAGFTNNVAPYYQAASGAAQTGLGTLGGASGAVSGGLGTLGGALNGLGSTVGVSMPTYSAGMNNLAMAGTTYGNALNALGGIGQMGQAYIDGGSNLAYQGAGTVSPTQFSSDALQPFLYAGQQNLVDATLANVRQNNATQQNDVITNAIKSGNAFGGDRMGVAQAELARQQDLATNQTLQSLNQANYSQAVSGFQNQRDANVAAQENNYARQLQAASTLGNLGTASVNAQLAPLQASLQAASGLASTGVAQGNLGSSYQASMMAPYTAMAGIGGQQTSAGSALSGIGGQQLSGGQTLSGIGTATLGSYLQPTQAQISALGTQLSAGQQSLGASSALLGQSGAQLAGGQVQQQTEQNALTNAYNQFLLSQQYPFQTGSWLTGIAAGLGSGLGGTSSTTSPGPSVLGQVAGLGLAGAALFSDERVKDDIRPVGKTFDGQPIYSFRYKGSDATQMGLMAQDVEQRHPNAVGSLGGIKVVDYDAATRAAAEKGKFARGGAVPRFASGGAAMPGIGMDPSGLPYSGLAQIQIVPAYNGARMSGVGIPSAPAVAVQTNPFANLATGSSAGNASLAGLSKIGSSLDLGSTISNGVSSAVGFNPFNGFRRGGVARAPSLGNLALKHYDDGGAVGAGLEDVPMYADGPVLDRSVLGGVPTSFAALGPASDGAAAIPPSYVSRVVHVESRGDPNAVSSTGAKGLGQFTAGTARAVGLADPFDPEASKAAIARLAASNRDALRDRIGRDPTEEELYAAHQQGAGGAAALINNPTARAGDVLGDRAVRVNGGDPNMPARDFLAKVKSLYSGAPEPTTTGSLGDVAANSNGAGLGRIQIAEPSTKQALLAAGLAMMASRSPFALSAIGEGGLAGLANYRGQQEMAQKAANTQSEIQHRSVEEGQGQQRIGLESRSLTQRADQAAKDLALRQKAEDRAQTSTTSENAYRDVQTGSARFTRTPTAAGLLVIDNLNPNSPPKLVPWQSIGTPDVPGSDVSAAPPAEAPPASLAAPAAAPTAPASPAPPAQPQMTPQDADRAVASLGNPAPASAPAAPSPVASAPASPTPTTPTPATPTPPAPAAPRASAPTPDTPSRVHPPARIPLDPMQFSQSGQGIAAEQTKKALDASKQAYDASQTTKVMLGQMQHDLATLPKNGFLTAGPGFQARADIAGKVNQALRGIGVGDAGLINPEAVASAEELKKLTNRMGFDLAKSMGGREPGFIVQQAVGSVPGGDNSPMGAQRLIAGIQAMAQRQEDYHLFLEEWASKSGGSTTGADAYFNKVSPPSKYVAQAVVATLPSGAVDMLRKNPALAASFNAKYGPNTASYVLGK